MGLYNLWYYFPNSPIQLPKNIFVSATTPPTGVVHEVALTLTNTQTSQVTAGTPVSLDINWTTWNKYSSSGKEWVAKNLTNVMFYDSEGSGTGQPLNAWMEGCSNSTITGTASYATACNWTYTNSQVWLKLNATGIPASTTIIVYLGFLSNTTNNFNTAANGCTDCWGKLLTSPRHTESTTMELRSFQRTQILQEPRRPRVSAKVFLAARESARHTLSENNGLNFTITTSVAGAGFPTGIQAYFSFTIQNTQSSPIPTGSTVSISVPWGQYSPYAASNYQNVEFFNSSKYSMNAWLDGTSNGIGTVWLKLTGPISASTTNTYYIAFYSTGTNFFNSAGPWGEYPTATGTYGQYDDGSHVFAFYTNFAGSSLPAGWTTSSFGGGTSADAFYVSEALAMDFNSTTMAELPLGSDKHRIWLSCLHYKHVQRHCTN